MGQRGPAPQPTALKILRGNPGKRALNKREPQPEATIPDCPAHLDDVARAEWGKIVPVLTRMRVLTEADYITLANLCQTYSRWIAAQSELNKVGTAGFLYKTSSGYIQVSPLLTIVNTCVDQLTKLCREFGLTPSSRSGIRTTGDAEKAADPWAKFA